MESAVLEKPASPELQDIIDNHFGGNHEGAKVFLNGLRKAHAIQAKRQRKIEFQNQLLTLQQAQSVGADYYEATGELPYEDMLETLHLNGYAPAPAEYLSTIFYDLDDYHSHVMAEVESRQEEVDRKRQNILQTIDGDLQLGFLHPVLLLKTRESKGLEQAEAELDAGRKVRWNMRIPQNEEVEEDEKIRRYALFKIAERLTKNLEEDEGLGSHEHSTSPLVRRTNAVLGFNIETGKVLSSFASEIHKSNSLLSPEEAYRRVEEIAHEEGWLEFIEPQLKEAISASFIRLRERNYPSFPNPESFYNLERKGLIMATRQRTKIETYFYENGQYPPGVFKMAELLVDHSIRLEPIKTRAYKYKEWNRLKFISYGRWLLSVIEPTDKDITARILDRAQRLGLGPGTKAITDSKHFDSLIDFFNQIGVPKKPKGQFVEWSEEQWIAWVKEVFEDEGKVNIKIIQERAKTRKDQPSLKVLSTNNPGGLTGLLEEAGLPAPKNKPMSLEECVSAGIRYAQDLGKIPGFTELATDSSLPSVPTIYKFCGSIPAFKQMVAETIDKINQEQILAQAA